MVKIPDHMQVPSMRCKTTTITVAELHNIDHHCSCRILKIPVMVVATGDLEHDDYVMSRFLHHQSAMLAHVQNWTLNRFLIMDTSCSEVILSGKVEAIP